MLGGGVVNSVSDFLITVLPIPIVMRLQMPLKQRIGVCILLCLGMIVTIAGSLRTYFTWKSLMASWDETVSKVMGKTLAISEIFADPLAHHF